MDASSWLILFLYLYMTNRDYVSFFWTNPVGIASLIGMLVLFVLGLILESISIILITTPVILPVMTALGIDKVWYGVLLTINLELALISPPVGMNLIVIKSITKAPLSEIDRAAVPYILMLILGIAIIIVFPGIALWLPSTMDYKP